MDVKEAAPREKVSLPRTLSDAKASLARSLSGIENPFKALARKYHAYQDAKAARQQEQKDAAVDRFVNKMIVGYPDYSALQAMEAQFANSEPGAMRDAIFDSMERNNVKPHVVSDTLGEGGAFYSTMAATIDQERDRIDAMNAALKDAGSHRTLSTDAVTRMQSLALGLSQGVQGRFARSQEVHNAYLSVGKGTADVGMKAAFEKFSAAEFSDESLRFLDLARKYAENTVGENEDSVVENQFRREHLQEIIDHFTTVGAFGEKAPETINIGSRTTKALNKLVDQADGLIRQDVMLTGHELDGPISGIQKMIKDIGLRFEVSPDAKAYVLNGQWPDSSAV